MGVNKLAGMCEVQSFHLQGVILIVMLCNSQKP